MLRKKYNKKEDRRGLSSYYILGLISSEKNFIPPTPFCGVEGPIRSCNPCVKRIRIIAEVRYTAAKTDK